MKSLPLQDLEPRLLIVSIVYSDNVTHVFLFYILIFPSPTCKQQTVFYWTSISVAFRNSEKEAPPPSQHFQRGPIEKNTSQTWNNNIYRLCILHKCLLIYIFVLIELKIPLIHVFKI